MICSSRTENIFSFYCLLHLAWFQGLEYIPPSFGPWVTNHDIKSKKLKKWYIRWLLFYTTFFLWCWQIQEKTKNIHEGHTKILVCTTYKVNIWNIPPETAKVSTLIKFFDVEKNLGMLRFSRFRDWILKP